MAREYIVETRDNVSLPWRPMVDLDPVPDRGDLATQEAVHQLRATVTELNRKAGCYRYRTRYVQLERCEANAYRGTGTGICDQPLDEHYQCPRASDHVV